MVEALVQCDQKIENLYNQLRDDPMYEEAIQRVRGVKKDEDAALEVSNITGEPTMSAPKRPSSAIRGGPSMLIAPSVLRQTGYGASAFGGAEAGLATGLNIRVRLQDRDEDDDLSNEENDLELEVDESERTRIKMEAMKKQKSQQNSANKKKQ